MLVTVICVNLREHASLEETVGKVAFKINVHWTFVREREGS